MMTHAHRLLFFVLAVLVIAPAWSDAQSQSTAYSPINLISNSAVWTLNFDTSLRDPQGMARSPDGPWLVADEGRGRITPYNGDGLAFPGLSPSLVIAIPEKPSTSYNYPAPVGIVYNGTSDFELAPGLPAEFLVATRDGTIEGWNKDAYRNAAVTVVNNSSEAAYTGIAVAQVEEGNRLYAANFGQNRIDVFDGDFSLLLLSGHAFTDPALPERLSPFNIQNINNRLYVTFAAPTDDRSAAPGEGAGYVAVFDTEGERIMRLEPGPWMDAPWGIALASDRFGEYSHHLLVGNAGSGSIATFDENTGLFTGFLSLPEGAPIIIPGLHGLGFGNDGQAGPSDTLYFTSGFRDSEPNIFGAIKALAPQPAPASSPE